MESQAGLFDALDDTFSKVDNGQCLGNNLDMPDVGVAIGSGASIAREVADITIAAEDLRELALLRELSQKLMGRIDRNYRFVMGFNGALIALGAFGVLPPATSALLHNSSTLLLSMDCMTPLLPEIRGGTK